MLPGLPYDKLIKPILWVGGIGVGSYLLYKMYQGSETRDTQALLDNSPEAQQANTLLSLLHPYSYKGLQLDPFGTLDVVKDKIANVDEAAVIATAKGITNFDKVAKYYKGLTGGRLNLPDDLRRIMNVEEQTAFFDKININNNTKTEASKPFDLYAAPTKGTIVGVYEDMYFKKPLFSYKAGTKLGKALKLITVPVRTTNGTIVPTKLYYILGAYGKITGKNVYVLVSQVSKTKPR